ncbi:MAG: class I SAM-dependent methyltransferase [Lachnospiraceae bacterium]|nr:class I SAM-dependent methyltransferase [Lachnospiraceae bacterium]
MMNKLVLLAEKEDRVEKAVVLAEKLHIELVRSVQEVKDEEIYLLMDEEGLSLIQGGLKMRGDFLQMLPRLKPGKLHGEMLIKASKLKGLQERPVVIDATAGMGEDSLLLAAAGYEVYLFEKDPIIAALLEDALDRAIKEPVLGEVVKRMHLSGSDSIEAMKEGKIQADLVYLDPMFPARSKSGLIKKKFQLLQQLERPCSDEEELVKAALLVHPKRIVIKRPAKGPYLAGIKPSYSIDGKAIRYDCLVP